jgi:hypothetical protein
LLRVRAVFSVGDAGARHAVTTGVAMLARSPAPRWSEGSSSSVRARSREQERVFHSGSTSETGAQDPLAPAASFRVYTPAEIRSAPLRPSSRPRPARGLGEELKDGLSQAEAAGPRALLKWLGVGVAIGTLLLTAFVLLLNLTDDTQAARSTKSRTAMSTEDRWTPSLRLPVAPPRPPAVIQTPLTDFELPDDAPPVQTKKERTAKSRGAVRPAAKPKATLRSAPF